MITKETTRDIYNCYQQIEDFEKIKAELLEKLNRIREKKVNEEPISENDFGRFGKGMQLVVPDESGSSMKTYNISPEVGLCVMEVQAKELKKRLNHLGIIASIELKDKNNNDNG